MQTWKKIDVIGYKIEPGSETVRNSPLYEFTTNVCLQCLQLTDKKTRPIYRIPSQKHTVCDRCFRDLSTGKLNTDLYEQVTRKDLVAFYRRK